MGIEARIIEGGKKDVIAYLRERREFEQGRTQDMSIPLFQRDYAKGAVQGLDFAIDVVEDWRPSDG